MTVEVLRLGVLFQDALLAVDGVQQIEPARQALDRNVARLNEVVFGPQDYALVARA